GRRPAGRRLEGLGIRERHRSLGTLPPTLPATPCTFGRFDDQAVSGQSPQVVARRTARLPRELGERRCGLRSALAEDVVDRHPERMSQRPQRALIQLMHLVPLITVVHHAYKATFAYSPLQGFLCNPLCASRSSRTLLAVLLRTAAFLCATQALHAEAIHGDDH